MAQAPGETLSSRFAGFVADLAIESVPPRVIEKAKLRLIDCVATALAARDLEVPALAFGLVRGNRGECTVIGFEERLPPIDAAFVNATLVNGRSQDDFLAKSHAGAVTVPAALAVAEASRRTGADVLLAIIAGYEIVGRVYMGGPAMLPRFRASGVAGTVGAAAAAAKLSGLDAIGIRNALGIAACFSHGFGQGFLSGSTEVKLNVGMASRSGVSAAMLASMGATASPEAFEGDAGFYHAFSNGVGDAEAATLDLGTRYLIEETVYKECPVCIFTQTPIALARGLAAQVRAGEIDKVVVRSPLLTHTNPGFTNVAPFTTHLQAVVSARFCTAAALLGRRVESYEFYDELDDPEVVALARKIELVARPEDKERVDLEVVQGGKTLRASAIEMDTLTPTAQKVIAKLRRLAGALPGVDVEAIIDTVMDFDRCADVGALTALLGHEPQARVSPPERLAL